MMSKFKNLVFSALLSLGAFGAVTFTACTQDECKDVVCNNGGTCISGTCSCPTGFEGNNCETRTRDKFVGTWGGSDVCGSGTYTITLSISAATGEINALVANPGGFGAAVTVTGNVTSANSLAFTNVSVGGGRTLTGTMTFSGATSTTNPNPNAMQFIYTVTPATGAADNCTGNYTRQ